MRACVAACPNASAALFTGARISHPGLLPQGQAERSRRALRMVAQFNTELFGSCTNIGECEAVCPKEIRLDVIARVNHDYLKAKWEDRSWIRLCEWPVFDNCGFRARAQRRQMSATGVTRQIDPREGEMPADEAGSIARNEAFEMLLSRQLFTQAKT